MAVITWPAALKAPAEFSISQARYDMVENSDATGSQSARLFGPPRWRVSLRSIDAFSLRDAGVYEAMLLQLRGGINHLALHDPVRAQPQGTLRGSPVLQNTIAAGATSLSIAGATGTNMLWQGGFEVDANVNNVADGWNFYVSTGAPATAAGLAAGNNSPNSQRIDITALNTAVAGVQSASNLPVVAGQTYTFSIDVKADAATNDVHLYVAWYTAGLIFLSDSRNQTAGTVGWVRRQLTMQAPATAAYAVPYCWLSDTLGAPSSYSAYFDNAQFQFGATATAFDGQATLRCGDWLQIGSGLGTSQLVKVVADATALNTGVIQATFEPPLRQQFNAGTVVVWDRPLAYYKQLGAPQWSYRPGRRMQQGGFALDLLEAFA